jgi:NADH-quinone oxidoreductase subunit M
MRILAVIATMSIVVTAVYVLRGLSKVFYGPITNHHFEELGDATIPERISTGVLVATLFIVGLMPWYFIDLIEGSLFPILNRLHEASAMSLAH